MYLKFTFPGGIANQPVIVQITFDKQMMISNPGNVGVNCGDKRSRCFTIVPNGPRSEKFIRAVHSLRETRFTIDAYRR